MILGKDRWFFLGDRYANTRTNSRKDGNDQEAVNASKSIASAQAAWKIWFEERGVAEYKILIGPNKSTVFPEYAPAWASPPDTSTTDTLYAKDLAAVYVDVRQQLLNSKSLVRPYYRTDTHWNDYGAGVAYQEFFNSIAVNNPDLVALDPSAYQLTDVQEMSGGDLSSFLKIQSSERDIKPVTGAVKRGLEHFIYQYETDKLLYQGVAPVFGDMNELHLINTPAALNNKKILWLSDSFGNALSHYMTASFNDVLKVHWGQLTGKKKLETLVSRWKPDYVFVTVVERAAFAEAFKKYPSVSVAYQIKAIDKVIELTPPRLHQVEVQESNYRVTGQDPFLIYDFKDSINGDDAAVLTFNIHCTKPREDIPIQVFWRSSTKGFNEQDSVSFTAMQGSNQLRMSRWSDSKDMSSIRIDLDGKVECNNFKLSGVSLGNYSL